MRILLTSANVISVCGILALAAGACTPDKKKKASVDNNNLAENTTPSNAANDGAVTQPQEAPATGAAAAVPPGNSTDATMAPAMAVDAALANATLQITRAPSFVCTGSTTPCATVVSFTYSGTDTPPQEVSASVTNQVTNQTLEGTAPFSVAANKPGSVLIKAPPGTKNQLSLVKLVLKWPSGGTIETTTGVQYATTGSVPACSGASSATPGANLTVCN